MKRVSTFGAVLLTAGLAGGPALAAVGPAPGASAPVIITTVAGGTGSGRATGVAQTPLSVLTGPGGALYVGDVWVVRKLTTASPSEKAFAGVGVSAGISGVGPVTQRVVGSVTGMALDAAGNLVIPDGVDSLQVVAAESGTFYGQAMTAGDIYTIAGNGTAGFSGDGKPATSARVWAPVAVAVSGAGNVLIADSGNKRVRQLTG